MTAAPSTVPLLVGCRQTATSTRYYYTDLELTLGQDRNFSPSRDEGGEEKKFLSGLLSRARGREKIWAAAKSASPPRVTFTT